MKMKLLLKLCLSLTLKPRGVYIGIREEGGQGTRRDPKRRARRRRMASFPRQKPHFRGCPWSACAAPPGGAQETRCDPKWRERRRRMAAETRQKPRFHGCPWAARAAPPGGVRGQEVTPNGARGAAVWPRKRGFPWAARAAPPAG